jgi:hypothetical protein
MTEAKRRALAQWMADNRIYGRKRQELEDLFDAIQDWWHAQNCDCCPTFTANLIDNRCVRCGTKRSHPYRDPRCAHEPPAPLSEEVEECAREIEATWFDEGRDDSQPPLTEAVQVAHRVLADRRAAVEAALAEERRKR